LSDPDFFYGPEDIEFSRRIYDKKGSLKVDLDTKIFHAVTQSFKNLSKRRMYFEYKYRLLINKKNWNFL
jgi:GT2 family glycosyltransferase